jgi:hypothetical protein
MKGMKAEYGRCKKVAPLLRKLENRPGTSSNPARKLQYEHQNVI